MTDPLGAIGAIQKANLNSLMDRAVQSQSPPVTTTSTSFSDVMARYAEQTMTTLQTGEATSIAAMRGEASTQEVVQAVIASEQALQVSIAIRDKVVQSYLELGRMTI